MAVPLCLYRPAAHAQKAHIFCFSHFAVHPLYFHYFDFKSDRLHLYIRLILWKFHFDYNQYFLTICMIVTSSLLGYQSLNL